MAHKVMAEVRFDCELHDMDEEQALGMLRGLAEYNPIVGLAFEGKAGVILNVDETDVLESIEEAIELATTLDLLVTETQVMSLQEYEDAAWAEVDLSE